METRGQDNRKEGEVTFDDVIRRVKNGLFGILFVTNKHSESTPAFTILENIVDHIQDLGFPLCFTLAQWQPEIKWLQVMLTWFSPERLIANTPVVFDALLSLLGLVLLNALWVGYSFSQNRFRFIWTLKVLRATLGLFATIMYIPILSFFAASVVDCGEETNSCWDSGNLLKSISTVIIIFIFIVLALLVKASFFEPDPKTKDISSRPHSRCDVAYLGVRTVLTVMTIVLQKFATSTALWLMALTCAATSSTLFFLYCWFVPFYNINYACLRAGMMANFCWASLCFVFTVVRPYSDIGIMYLLLSPLAFFVAWILIHARRRMVLAMPITAITDPFTVELKVRYRLERAGCLYHEGGASGASATTATTPRSPSDIEIGGSTATATSEMAVNAEIIEILVAAAKQMPKSCMLHLFSASFYLIHMNNRAQCLALTAKAETMAPRIDEAFMIFRRQRLLNERFSGGDVIDFIAYEQNMQMARRFEKRATAAIVQFWSELLRSKPSFKRIQAHGAAISSAISSAQTHYLALVKLSPDSAHVMRLYGNFLLNILNDKKQGLELLDRADELEEAHNDNLADDANSSGDENRDSSGSNTPGGHQEGYNNLDIFDNSNAIITISGEIASLGVIKNVNSQVLSIFGGYKRHELVGHNVNKLIPAPFAEAHNNYLARYLETGYAKIIDRARQVLGLDKSGRLFPFTLCVKHVVDEAGAQSFVGVIRANREVPGTGFLILSEKLVIMHLSASIEMLFYGEGHSQKPRHGEGDETSHSPQEAKLSDWLPSVLESSLSQIIARGGLRLTGQTIRGTRYDVVISGERIPVAGDIAVIARMKFKRLTKQIASDTLLLPDQHHSIPDADAPGTFGPGCPFAPKVESKSNSAINLGSSRSGNASEIDDGAMPMAFSPQTSIDNIPSVPSGLASRRGSNVNWGGGPILKKFETRSNVETSSQGSGSPPTPLKKDDDASSQSSHSASKSNSFVKSILSVTNKKWNRRIMYLHRSYIVCIAILVALAIVDDVMYRQMHGTMQSAVGDIVRRSEAVVNMITLADVIRSISLGQNITGDDLTTHVLLGDQIALLRGVQEIFTVPTAGSSTTLPLLHADGSVLQVVPLEAIIDTLGRAQFVYNAVPTDPTLPVQISTVIANAASPGMINMMNSTIVESLNSFSDASSYQSGIQSLARSCIGPVVFLIALIALIRPLCAHIEESRELFLQMFLDIPKEFVRAIHDTHYERLVAADEEDGDDDIGTKIVLDKMLGSIQKLHESGNIHASTEHVSEESRGADSGARKSKWLSGPFLGSRFKDQHRLILKSMSVLLFSAVFFFTSGGLRYTMLESLSMSGIKTFWDSQRPIQIREVSFAVREVLINNKPSAVDLARQAIAQTLWTEDIVLYGSQALGLPGLVTATSDPRLDLELYNGCVPASSPPDCKTVNNGLLSGGLHSTISWFASTASTIVDSASSAPSNAINTALISLRAIDRDYLTPALQASRNLYSSDVDSAIANFNVFHVAFTVTFSLALVVIYLLLVRPTLNVLGEDARRTAALVYMLPPEVFAKVPSFRHWAEKNLGVRSAAGHKEKTTIVVASREKDAVIEKERAPRVILESSVMESGPR